jgi:hypothetical protein
MLGDQERTAMDSAFWHAYAKFLGVLLVVMYATVMLASFKVTYLADLPLTVIAYVGLLGYAYQRRLGSRLFWQVYCLVFVAWELVFNFALSDTTDIGALTVAVGGLVLLGPEYLALWRYGFRCNDLWISGAI